MPHSPVHHYDLALRDLGEGERKKKKRPEVDKCSPRPRTSAVGGPAVARQVLLDELSRFQPDVAKWKGVAGDARGRGRKREKGERGRN